MVLQYKLLKWLAKQPKLVTNTFAGQTDNVITVNSTEGIVFDLIHFNEKYLKKYYSEAVFAINANRLMIALAAEIKESAIEFNQNDITIKVVIKLNRQSVTRTMRYENQTIFLSI